MEQEKDEWYLARQIVVGTVAAGAILGSVYYWAQFERQRQLERQVQQAVSQFLGTVNAIEGENGAQAETALAAHELRARQQLEAKGAKVEANAAGVRAQADLARTEQE